MQSLKLTLLLLLCLFSKTILSQNGSSPFSVNAIPGDEKWDWQFDKTGLDLYARCALADSDIVYIGGTFSKAGGVNANNIAYWDGKIWHAMGAGIGNSTSTVMAIKKYDNYVYACGPTGVERWDGTSWTNIGNLTGPVTGGLSVNDIDVDALGNLYALGQFEQINGVTAKGIAKWNGTNWSAMGSGIGPLVSGTYTNTVVANGSNVFISGVFTSVGGVAVSNIAKWNGVAWSPLANGLNGPSFITSQGTSIIAAGTFTTAGSVNVNNVAKWDGTSWSAMGDGFNSDAYDVITYGNDVYVAGFFTQSGTTPVNHIARWDGTNWIDAGNGIEMLYVSGLAISSKHFFANGSYGSISNLNQYTVVRWNGSRWTGIGNGVNGNIYAMTTFGNNILIGGDFTEVGGLKANRFAIWDGVKWDTLLNEFSNGRINAITIWNNEIYVGGNFNLNNNVTGNYLVKWNGSNWVPVGNDVDYTVFVIEGIGSSLYVGGEFTDAGAVSTSKIARWDGTNWFSLGSGTNNTVKAIKADTAGNIYVGGLFTTAGGNTVNRIAKWNGTAWSAMASGVNGTVNAIGISPNNDIYIGGAFDIAVNSNLVDHFAKWNGSNWIKVGGSFPTISNTVFSIAFACGQMYVAGAITTASGNTVNNVTRWDGTNWNNLGAGILFAPPVSTFVTAMTVKDDNLYLGGNFVISGDKPARNFAGYKIEGFPEVAITTNSNVICSGDTTTFTTTVTNAGTSPTYQWFVNGIATATGNAVFTSSSLTDNDTVWLVVTTNPSCAAVATIISNSIVIQVDTLTVPVVTVAGNTLTVNNPAAGATYIWQVEQAGIWNDIVPLTTGISFTFTSAGSYRARAVKGGCEYFSNTVIALGLDNIPSTQNILLYPNPIKDELSITGFSFQKGDEIKITDVLGKEIFKSTVINTTSTLKLNTSQFKEGIYFFEITSDDMKTIRRFIKAN